MNPFGKWTEADVARFNAGRHRALDAMRSDAPKGVEHESDLHDDIEGELKRRGWYYVHSRLDRPTTTALGVADFIIAAPDGRTFWIEAKGRKTKVTPHQQGMLHWLERLKHRAAIVRSLEDFLKVVDGNLAVGSQIERTQ